MYTVGDVTTISGRTIDGGKYFPLFLLRVEMRSAVCSIVVVVVG